jgi:hypothetical protein
MDPQIVQHQWAKLEDPGLPALSMEAGSETSCPEVLLTA